MLGSLIEGNTALDLYEHFTVPGHFGFLHVTVTLIDKTDRSCPTRRKDYWIELIIT